jgi:hypothetical protein
MSGARVGPIAHPRARSLALVDHQDDLVFVRVHDGDLIASVEVLATFKRRSLSEHALREALKFHASGNVTTNADVSYINFSAALDVVEDQFLLFAAQRKLR